MKSLQAFWHWVDNERPAEITYRHLEPLSPVADRALDLACELVCERLGRYATPIDKLREHWPAVQGLSFLLCTALEVMHEDVPEVPARPSEAPSADVIVVDSADMNDPRNWVMRTVETPWLQPVTVPGSALEYRREYQGEWVTEQQMAMQRAALTGDITLQSRARSHITDDHLVVFTTITADELERFRGYEPRAITVRGKPSDYPDGVRPYLGAVLGAMLDRAILCTPECHGSVWLHELGHRPARLEPPVGSD